MSSKTSCHPRVSTSRRPAAIPFFRRPRRRRLPVLPGATRPMSALLLMTRRRCQSSAPQLSSRLLTAGSIRVRRPLADRTKFSAVPTAAEQLRSVRSAYLGHTAAVGNDLLQTPCRLYFLMVDLLTKSPSAGFVSSVSGGKQRLSGIDWFLRMVLSDGQNRWISMRW